MKVYRVNKEGFVESLNTDGSYHPPRWFKTIAMAIKYANKKK